MRYLLILSIFISLGQGELKAFTMNNKTDKHMVVAVSSNESSQKRYRISPGEKNVSGSIPSAPGECLPFDVKIAYHIFWRPCNTTEQGTITIDSYRAGRWIQL